MDLRLLRYFLAVIDHGGVTRAAQALYVAQPSVSQSVRTLEQRLGVELFERVGRGLVLTNHGRELETRARAVVAEVEVAHERVARVRAADAGRLTIAVTATLAIHPLGPWVRLLLVEHPDLRVHVSEREAVGDVLAELRDGVAEVGLVELPVHEASLETVELEAEELVLAAGPRTAAGLPAVVPRSSVGRMATGALMRSGSNPTVSERETMALLGTPRLRCTQPQLLWDAVEQDAVVAVVPRAVGVRMVRGAHLLPLDPPLRRRVGLVRRAGSPSPAVRALLARALPQLS